MADQGKILVIDDKLENIQVLYSLLGGEGFEVSVSTNGIQAIKDVLNDIPDLILLDVNMPGMDGYEVCKHLKRTPQTKEIPIIFITGNTEEEKVSHAFEVGAVDYITKPIKAKELICRINTHLNLKKAIIEAQKARADADLANRAKGEFLAMMSHEIRTPMNAILGFTEILSERCSGEDLSQINMIHNAGKSLLNLINDVLDISKVEAGKMEIQKISFSPAVLCREVYHIFNIKAQQKDLLINLSVDKEVPETIVSDEHRIRQILFNLLSNSLKFTDKGTINISVSTQITGQFCDLRIDVEDSGRGIPENDQAKIFEKFEQVTKQESSKFGGTGLGLAISQKLAALLGGQLSVVSQWGKGSTFSMILKKLSFSKKIICKEKVKQSYSFSPANILIVGDSLVNRELFTAYFKESGLQLRTAENGLAALQHINQSKPDLILMELHMEAMNGQETLQAIRADKRFTSIPIVASSATVLQKDQLKEMGTFDNYLTKPFSKSQVLDLLSKYLQCEKTSSIVQAPETITRPDIGGIIQENVELRQALKKHLSAINDARTIHDLQQVYELLKMIRPENPDFTHHIELFKKSLDAFDVHQTSKWLQKLKLAI